MVDSPQGERLETDAEYWGRQRLLDLMLRRVDPESGLTTWEESYEEAFQRIGAKKYVDFVVRNRETGKIRQREAAELIRKFGARVLLAGETEQDLARRISNGFGLRPGETEEAGRRRVSITLGLRPVPLEEVSADFEQQTYEISAGELGEKINIAVYRTERAVRVTLSYREGLFSKAKPLPVDYEFDQIVTVERERLKDPGPLEVVTLITTHETMSAISAWDPRGTIYKNIRSALGR